VGDIGVVNEEHFLRPARFEMARDLTFFNKG